MSTICQIESRLNRIQRLRFSTEDRYLARQERIEKKAFPLIGELRKDGAKVYYAWPFGEKYFESTNYNEVANWLCKKGYIRA